MFPLPQDGERQAMTAEENTSEWQGGDEAFVPVATESLPARPRSSAHRAHQRGDQARRSVAFKINIMALNAIFLPSGRECGTRFRRTVQRIARFSKDLREGMMS